MENTCSTCGRETSSPQKTPPQCLICSKVICPQCDKYKLCDWCSIEYPIESKEIKETSRTWTQVLYLSLGVIILDGIVLGIDLMFNTVIQLNFLGDFSQTVLWTLIFGIALIFALFAVFLRNYVPKIIAQMERLKFGQEKIEHQARKIKTPLKRPQVLKKSPALQSGTPRIHDFISCRRCGKLNKRTNEHCVTCETKLR